MQSNVAIRQNSGESQNFERVQDAPGRSYDADPELKVPMDNRGIIDAGSDSKGDGF